MSDKTYFKTVRISELPFEYTGQELSQEEQENTDLQFLLIFQYQSATDLVAVHSALRFVSHEGKTILSAGSTVIANIPGWKNFSGSADDVKSSDAVRTLVSYSYAVMTGMFFKSAVDTQFHNATIPYISSDELMENLKVEKVR